MRIGFVRGALAATVALGVTAVMASAAYASHKWGTYHWARATTPFTLTIINNLDSNWTNYLVGKSGSITQWNSPTDTTNVPVSSTSPSNRTLSVAVISPSGGMAGNCSAIAGKTVVCNRKFGGTGWLGLAQIWLNGDHITQGVAKMNDTYFNLSTYNNPNEKLHVMCQEIAHTFGLGHQSTSGASLNTCMDYFSNTGGNSGSILSTWPNTHDFGQLSEIYAHADSSTTVAAAPQLLAAVPSEIDDTKGWGRLVAQTNSGRHSNYERVFPNGVRVLTDVLWAPDIAAACPSCDHRNQRAP